MTPSIAEEALVVMTLWAARVYRARDTYKRADPLVLEKNLDVDGWNATIIIGQVPAEILRANAISDAALSSSLDYSLIPQDAESLTARDAHISAQVDAYHLPDWVRTDGLYTSITVSRAVEIKPDGNRASSTYFWFDYLNAVRVATTLEESRNSALEQLTWLLLQRLDASLFAQALCQSRFYIETPGKPPCPIPQFSAGAITVSRGRNISWLDDRLVTLSAATNVPEKDRTGIIRISRFSMEQISESDPFKRFMWCYAGLELAANKLYSLLKPHLGTSLAVIAEGRVTTGAAVEELLWPVPDDPAKEPWRSIRFKFAVMALMLSPDTADRDIST
ncbi:MAG: hypothetical protein ACREBC_28650, partial [Pyrinomonadaceae bacterium]